MELDLAAAPLEGRFSFIICLFLVFFSLLDFNLNISFRFLVFGTVWFSEKAGNAGRLDF